MRQYIARTALSGDGLLEVQGKDYRYMKQVLRLAAGDMLSVRLTDGRLQGMTVARIDEQARRIVLQVCAGAPAAPVENMPAAAPGAAGASGGLPELWLFQFVARSAKMDLIIRQATECGVSLIVPVVSDFSQAGVGERNFRSERYQRIIREARQQSGSGTATRVHETLPLADAIALWKEHCGDDAAGSAGGSLGFVLYERTERTRSLYEAVGRGRIDRAALVCGAEGGISPAELEALCDAGFVPLHFKTNILRCETAALYGIAALQSALAEGDIWQCKE